MPKYVKILALVTAVAVCVALVVLGTRSNEVIAAVIRIEQMFGDIVMTNSASETLIAAEDMRVNSGDTITTKQQSYVYLDLDETKFAKLDEMSECGFNTADNMLSLDLRSGGVYFNVTEKIADDELFDIVTSTTVTSIRGTSGYVFYNSDGTEEIGLFTGEVEVVTENPQTTDDSTVTITAGQRVIVTTETAQNTQSIEVTAIDPDSFTPSTMDFLQRQQLVDDVQLTPTQQTDEQPSSSSAQQHDTDEMEEEAQTTSGATATGGSGAQQNGATGDNNTTATTGDQTTASTPQPATDTNTGQQTNNTTQPSTDGQSTVTSTVQPQTTPQPTPEPAPAPLPPVTDDDDGDDGVAETPDPPEIDDDGDDD